MYKSDYERSITKADVRIKRQVLLKRKKRCYGRQKLLVLKLHTLFYVVALNDIFWFPWPSRASYKMTQL